MCGVPAKKWNMSKVKYLTGQRAWSALDRLSANVECWYHEISVMLQGVAVLFQNGQLHVCAEDPERGHAGCRCGTASTHEQRGTSAALPPAAGKPTGTCEAVFQETPPSVR